jgi:hypothetical protein
MQLTTPAIRVAAVLAAAFAVLPLSAEAQADDWCARDLGRAQHCEIRQQRFAMTGGELHIDVGANGSVQVDAYEGSEVRVTARVVTRSRNEAGARDLAGRIEVRAGGDAIRATGPRSLNNESWTVSVRVLVPAGVAVDARTTNGRIDVNGTNGAVRLRTTNGSITASDVGSRVDIATTNGTVRITLAPGVTSIEGVRVRTTNGSVHLAVPDRISARLELSTTNGGIHTDIPITVQGRVNRRQVSAVLGNGGPEINIGTTNGTIRITAR